MNARLRMASTLAAVPLAAGVLVDCNQEPTVEELVAERIVVTKHDPTVSFASFTTFAMPETVYVLSSVDPASADPKVAPPSIADPTLREIAAQLTSRGYTQIARADKPDLGVAVTGLNRLQVTTYGSWWPFGSAAPSYWGYSGSTISTGFTYSTAAYQSGTLLIELDDLRAARAQPIVPNVAALSATPPRPTISVTWAALIHGVIGPAGSTIEEPPIASIQQAFAQSPYLHR